MALPWKTLDQFITEDEGILELRQRGKGDYLITVGSQMLMNSKAQRSEIALGKLGCQNLRQQPQPRVLVGGLGMAITLRVILDALPDMAQVTIAELNPKIHEWCLGPLAKLTGGAASDTSSTSKKKIFSYGRVDIHSFLIILYYIYRESLPVGNLCQRLHDGSWKGPLLLIP